MVNRECGKKQRCSMIAHIKRDNPQETESVKEHIERTSLACERKGVRCRIKKITKVCGELHDMGKCSLPFAEYICADEQTQRKLKGKVPHAAAGAKYLYDQYQDSPQADERLLAELIAYAISAHHGVFDMVEESGRDCFTDKLQKVEDFEVTCKNARMEYLDDKVLQEDFMEAVKEFQVIKEKMKMVMVENVTNLNKEKLEEQYLFLLGALQRLMLSILIDADWESTAAFMEGQENRKEELTAPEEVFKRAKENFQFYMERKQKETNDRKLTEKEKEIGTVREELQNQCKAFGQKPAGIYCLPIPTGGGKTLSGLAYALEFCEAHPETERIFYIAPYTSVIEQNADVFRKAVGNNEWVLEHHSAVVREQQHQGEEYRQEETESLDVNWEEPFICTTLVQFMNTLFSNQKKSVRRMHRLVNTVVIIDEVQAIPVKCINTFNYMMNFLRAVCNTTIILCTATQPRLGNTECPICYSSPKSMIEGVEEWFERLDRVEIQTPARGEKYSITSLADEIVRAREKYRSILVVLNTKSAVRKLYDALMGQGIEKEYLTTNLCADHRSNRIGKIKEKLKRQEPVIVISTNLIEAGVDISFSCVYRSMTGLDSLAQTAGRCNRNGELEKGLIRLIELEGEGTGSMKELQCQIAATRELLYENNFVQGELLKPEAMDKYYELLYRQDEIRDWMNFPVKNLDTDLRRLLTKGFKNAKTPHVMQQAYQTVGECYQVIAENSFGVIVPYGEGKNLIDEIRNTTDRAVIRNCIRKAQRYTVNVRADKLDEMKGILESVNEKFPGIYMLVSPESYQDEFGLAEELGTLIY